jgi:hypothetical protein
MIIGVIGVIKLMLRKGIVDGRAMQVMRLVMERPSAFEVGSSIRLRMEEENTRLELQEKVLESAFCINDMRVLQEKVFESAFCINDMRKLQGKVFESAFCISDVRVVQGNQIEKIFAKHIAGWARQGFSKIIAECTLGLVMQSPRLRAKAKCSINLSRISIGGTTEGVREAAATLK